MYRPSPARAQAMMTNCTALRGQGHRQWCEDQTPCCEDCHGVTSSPSRELQRVPKAPSPFSRLLATCPLRCACVCYLQTPVWEAQHAAASTVCTT
jgi:hypothetical protein